MFSRRRDDGCLKGKQSLLFQVGLIVACWLLLAAFAVELAKGSPFIPSPQYLGKFLEVCGQEMSGLLDYIIHRCLWAVDEAALKPVKLSSTLVHIMCQ